MYTVEATRLVAGKVETETFSSDKARGARWKAVRWINKSGSFVWEWRFVKCDYIVWNITIGEAIALPH